MIKKLLFFLLISFSSVWAGNYYGTFGTGTTSRDSVRIYVATFDTLGYRINVDSLIVKRFWGGATNPIVDSFIWIGAGTRTGFYDTTVAAEAGGASDSLGEWGLEIYWKVQGKSFNKEGFYIVVSGLPTGTNDPQDIRNLDTVNVLSTDTVNVISTDTIGVNWGVVANPTTTIGLTNTTVGTVTTTTTATNLTTNNDKTNYTLTNADKGVVADSIWRRRYNTTTYTDSMLGAQVRLIKYRADSLLAPTAFGRTLDVTAGGNAGIDWSNIGDPTTLQVFSGTTINTVTNEPWTAAQVSRVLDSLQAVLDTLQRFTKATTDSLQAVLDSLQATLDVNVVTWLGTAPAGLTTPDGNVKVDLRQWIAVAPFALNNQRPEVLVTSTSDSVKKNIASITKDSVWKANLDANDNTAGSFGDSAGGWGATSAAGASDTANFRLAGFMRRYTFGGGSDTSYTKNPAATMTGSAIDTLLVRDSCNNVNLSGVRVEVKNKSGQSLGQFSTPTSGRIILQGNTNDTVIVTERATTYTFSIPDTIVINGGDIDTVFGCLFTPDTPPQTSMVTLWGCLQDFGGNYGTGAEVNISLERQTGKILWKIDGADTTLADYASIKVNVQPNGVWQYPVFWSALYKYYDLSSATWVSASPKYEIKIVNSQGITLTGTQGLRVTARSVASQRVYSGQ